jgi:DNA-binding transcriptional LysR family regulator
MATDLNELQFFVQVARAQSFTAAAERLGAPKSSVSRAIHRLETRLGVRLLERTTRRVTVTEAGQIYLEHCQRVLDEAEQADLAVGALLGRPRGVLRVAVPVAFARWVLGPALGAFLTSYPELRLQLQLLDIETTIREGDLDVLIRAGPLESSGLLARPLLKIRLGVYASPAYLEQHVLPDSPSDLYRHSCLTTRCGGALTGHGDSTAWRLRRGSELQEVRIESRAQLPDPMINHQLALAGVGVALLAQRSVAADLAQGRLVRLLPDWEPEPIDLHALYASPLHSSPKVRVFLHFLRERLGGQAIATTLHSQVS